MKATHDIIGLKKVAEVLSTSDLTARIIKSHLTLELVINCLLSEVIVTDHKLELKKISFALKLDLCFSLIPMDKELKHLLHKINKIRNNFAHNHDAVFGEKEASDLLNAASPAFREGFNCFKNIKTPLEKWHACFYSSFILLNMAFSSLADYKAAQEVYNEEIDALLETLKPYLKEMKKKYPRKKDLTAKKIKSKVNQTYQNYQ